MKNRKQNLEEALALLKTRGWTVTPLPSGKWETWLGPANPTYPQFHTRTTREIVKLASQYSHNNKQQTAIKKSLKAESKCERAFVRDAIKKINDPDESDVSFPKKKFADLWNWD